jgi:hypothetical protein
MNLVDPTEAAACRARSAARHARARRGAQGKVALPTTEKSEESRHTAHWKYWRAATLRIAANNHRFDRLTELGMTSERDDLGLKRIHWPQRWEDYSFFKHDTYNNDEARTPPLNGMSLIYNKGQRITTRTQSGDPLNLHNFAWMWGSGGDTSSQGNGVFEFL